MTLRFRRGISHYRKAFGVIASGAIFFGGYITYIGDEKIYRNVIMPAFHFLDAETAHSLAIKAAKYKIVPRIKQPDLPSLNTVIWGKTFDNPIGLAAGFDKQGEAVDGLSLMGFGFIEVGSVTPEPQLGNPKPRMFRMTEDEAVINRYGFNSDGHEVVYNRLKNSNAVDSEKKGILGINLGKNKTSQDPVGDFVAGVLKFGELADYLVINVSSPNTPGLRDMQGRQDLQNLVDQVVQARDNLPESKRPPLLVKIAPDLTDKDKIDIAAVVGKRQSGVDGLIISNTTVSRPDSLISKHKDEIGGLSGKPLKDMSTQTIRDMYRLIGGRIPIVGVGGVSSGQDAYEKISAGASLVQLYSGMTYHGPPLVKKIKIELAEILKKNGFSSVIDAVGQDFKLENTQAIK